MKPGWWIAAVIAAVAVGGTLLYLRRFGGSQEGVFCLADDERALKDFGAFPPEMTEDEFDSLDFIV